MEKRGTSVPFYLPNVFLVCSDAVSFARNAVAALLAGIAPSRT